MLDRNFLDKQQLNAVLFLENHLLIIAGAGSGKTTTLMAKINYLLEQGFKEDEILCISFTNKAVNNMKEKLNNNNIRITTFHKLALSLLNKKYKICSEFYLKDIIDEFFHVIVLNNKDIQLVIVKYLRKYIYLKDYHDLLNNKLNYLDNLKNLIASFINIFKANNLELKDFKYIKCYFYQKKLMKIIINIYTYYENSLYENNMIDFNDMINLAINNKKKLSYKHILIDEYQDISLIRLELIKSIMNKKTILTVVGDDYQSIYRFAGSNINLFLNFEKDFNATILKIENTYRNSQELLAVTSRFILKNNQQIKKKLVSVKHCNKPVKVIYYKEDKITVFKKLIKTINKPNILVLMRNKKDINYYIDDGFKIDGENLYYLDYCLKILTVHKAKGLESDEVIILNLEDKVLGFPNKILDDDILKQFNKNNYYYLDEERRLFYVALTRTKNNVYLLVSKKKPSIFVTELIDDSKKYIDFIK